jgi:integrase/recombinase XerD
MSDAREIHLDVANHQNKKVVLIKFKRDKLLEDTVRQVNGARWSSTMTSWYVPYSVRALNQVKYLFEPISKIDQSLVKEKITVENTSTNYIPMPVDYVLTEDSLNKYTQYKLWMQSKRYSSSTINTYSDALKAFLKFFHQKPISEINNHDLIVFNNEFVLKHKLSASYQNQVVNAVKLFFKTVENKAIDIEQIHRPKREKVLPNVLSKEEVKLILNAQPLDKK